MREILFKAKRIDNGEWVEGYYWTNLLGNYFIRIAKNKTEKFMMEDIEINPDTLCQYTGLTDKNGVKIWENDIVKWKFKRIWKEDYHISQVVWDSFYSAFRTSVYGGFAKLREDIEYEIIGNVFDNPEILRK